jgi:polyhydroxyalkanoate synthesis regulator protein
MGDITMEFFKRDLTNENIIDLEEMETRIRQEMARRYQNQVDNASKYELQVIRKEIREIRELLKGEMDMWARFRESKE